MLVLSRKRGEQILVPHCELTVTVVAIDGNTVKLGITAPTNVGVYREELWRKVCPEKVAHQALAAAEPVMSSTWLYRAGPSRGEGPDLGYRSGA